MAEDNKLVEMIEFKAVAPKTALPGLDDVLNKVRAIDAAIDSLNARLSGLSTNSTFKRARSELAGVLKESNMKAPFTPADTARILGIPDPKDFEAYIQKNMAAYRKVMETRGGVKGFGSAEKAAGFTQKYFRDALKEAKQPMDLLHRLFGGAGLQIPTPVVHPVAPVGTGSAGASPYPGGPPKGGTPNGGGGGRGRSGGNDDYFTARLKVEQELERRLAQKNLSASGKGAAFGQAASQVDALLGVHGEGMSDRTVAAQRLFVEKLRRKQQQQTDKAQAEEMAGIEERGREEERRAAAEKRIQSGRVREVNKGLNAQERAAAEEEAARRASLASQEQLLKAEQRRAAARAKAADSVRRLEQGQAVGALSHEQGRGVLRALEAAGYTVGPAQRRQSVGPGGARSTEGYTATKDDGGQRLTTSVQFLSQNGRAVSATVTELNRKLKETRAEAGALGGDFIKNTAKVTVWSLSVAALYKTMQLATSSVASFIDTNAQMARLDQVYSKVGGTTRQLTSDILGLAAANGRTSTEAEQSAIEWSRLNLTRAETNEAVRVSLIAANVAEITAAEATSSLSSVMLAYNLRVKDLATVLGEMNAVSNAYKVTNKDMLAGLSQTANVAKQAKLPLAELMGIIGGAVGTSGQTGSRIGTMMKSTIIALSNPELQKNLRTGFQFEATQGGGSDIKDMSRLLGDLFVRYQDLNNAQRQNLLSQVAGKTQANRLAAALDSYVKGQVLAIQAQ
jgi:TP901 family phage tail tape measure protein